MAKVLVIDDERAMRDLLARLLVRQGHSVLEAEHGDAGLRLLEREPVDLVITDLLMPEKDGLETIRAIRARSPAIKIIAVSGGHRTFGGDYLPAARAMGADRAFQKPFSPMEVGEAVSELLQPA